MEAIEAFNSCYSCCGYSRECSAQKIISIIKYFVSILLKAFVVHIDQLTVKVVDGVVMVISCVHMSEAHIVFGFVCCTMAVTTLAEACHAFCT